MVQKFIWLAVAGGLGTLARFGLAGFVHRLNGEHSYWGTLIVNLTGCFVAGLVWMLFENRWTVSPEVRTLVLVGFMGAFTTFSALIMETSELLRTAEWMRAGMNLAIQNGVGFIALFSGAALGRML
jgi:fluoride exporter